jgi:hypothetical protein
MTPDFALTLWRADLVRFELQDRQLKTGKRVIANHAGWLRRYHGLDHLAVLFEQIEAQTDQITDLPRLIYAAWFHDAIYKSWRRDNEQRSADWAQTALVDMGASEDLAARVHRLILATADHAGGGADADDACSWTWTAPFWAPPLTPMTSMPGRCAQNMSGRCRTLTKGPRGVSQTPARAGTPVSHRRLSGPV